MSLDLKSLSVLATLGSMVAGATAWIVLQTSASVPTVSQGDFKAMVDSVRSLEMQMQRLNDKDDDYTRRYEMLLWVERLRSSNPDLAVPDFSQD